MHRWFGSSQDAEEQASQRDQRAARRFISSIPQVSESDDEYAECDSSLNNQSIFLGVDGADDGLADSDENLETDVMVLTAAELAAEKAKPFEDASFPDDDKAWEKEVTLKFDQQDVAYWFNSVEYTMKKYGINEQWSKKNAILSCLPAEVIDECKPILRLTETEAGDHIYKDLKTEIISLYGPRDEDVFQQAMSLRLTGKPSALQEKS